MATPDYQSTYQPLAVGIANQVGIPANIFTAVIGKESSWNPNAVGTSGEKGLGQIMPGNYKSLNITNPFDPVQNLTGSATMLKQLYQRFGNWNDALGWYNAGMNYGGKVGQAYAADVLARAGAPIAGAYDPKDSRSPGARAWDNILGPDVGPGPGTPLSKEVLEGKREADSWVKQQAQKWGLWALAGLLMVGGIYRMVVK